MTHTDKAQTDWEKRFDAYWDGYWGWNLPAENIGVLNTRVGIPSSDEVKQYIKPFIRQLLADREAVVREEGRQLERSEISDAIKQLSRLIGRNERSEYIQFLEKELEAARSNRAKV